MNIATSVLSQVYRFEQDGQDFIQVNSFSPDLTLRMATYMPPEGDELTDDDLLYDLYYSVQENKFGPLQRRFEKFFTLLPPGRPESPAYLEVAEGEEMQRRYAWEQGEEVSEAFSELDSFVTRIVTYSSIPSG